MEERIYSYNGDIWTFSQDSNGQFILRCIATGKDPDFPISQLRFDMDQLMQNRKISENPPINKKLGGTISMYHAEFGHQVLTLLAELSASTRIK